MPDLRVHFFRSSPLHASPRAATKRMSGSISHDVAAGDSVALGHTLATPRIERDGLRDFLAALERHQGGNATRLQRQGREIWLNGDYRAHVLEPFYRDALKQLRSDKNLSALLRELRAELPMQKSLTRYHENTAGRYFDSLFADALVRNPSARGIACARRMGHEVFRLLEHASSSESLPVLQRLAARIRSDQRPWFSECPEISAFLRKPDLETAQAMYTVVNHGHDGIKVPYLAVRGGWALGDVGVRPAWVRASNQSFGRIVGPERSGIAQKIETQTRRPGIMLAGQPTAVQPKFRFLSGKSWTDDKWLNLAQLYDYPALSTFETNALHRGHPIVNGASGSTNILTMLHRDIATRNSEHDADDALLNSIAFLVYDGGHSVHEVASVHATMMKAKLRDGTLTPGQADDLAQFLRDYKLDYHDIIPAGSEDAVRVRSALDQAFDATLANPEL